jgi:hypothetical protein
MQIIPSEVNLTGVYFPPLLVNGTLGILLMLVTVYLLNRYRLSRYFMFPHLVMLALSVIYTIILSLWVIPA